MTICLGKSCSFGLSRVPFVNYCQFMNHINFYDLALSIVHVTSKNILRRTLLTETLR